MLKLICFIAMLLFSSCGRETDGYAMDWLTAKDGYLLDESGNKKMLRGMSSHGIAWYPAYYHYNSMKNLKEEWKSNVFRIAMYTENWGGYTTNPEIKTKVNELVEAAISLDMYVIIDWHILSDGNPLTHADKAAIFFEEMSIKWSGFPNVIYEICNEPNGYANWYNSIKPYAQRIIPIIRKNSPKSLVIVGTGSWSQDIMQAVNDPVNFENIAYALHFYAGSHGNWLRDRIGEAKAKKATIFVTEWGTSQSSGSGGVYENESKAWLDYLEKEKVSWVNWSLAPKDETSAALRNNAPSNGNWSDSDLSASGRWVKNYLKSHQD